ETVRLGMSRESRSTAKASAARRFPRFEPRAMATLFKVQGSRLRLSGGSTFDPPHRENAPTRARAVRPSSQQVRPAGERLVEEPFVLERLAKDDAQQAAMARVRHGLDARSPNIDELLRRRAVFADEL